MHQCNFGHLFPDILFFVCLSSFTSTSRFVLEASSPSACACLVDLIVAIELRIKGFELGYFFLPLYVIVPLLSRQLQTSLSSMTYNPSYDNYDPYMSRSLSRRPSIGYPGTPYPHQVYPDGISLSHPGSGVSFYNNYIPFFLTSTNSTISHIRFMRLPEMQWCPHVDSHQVSGNNKVQLGHFLTRSLGYENMDEPYYDERSLSLGHHAMSSMAYPRHRRHSTVSFATMPSAVDPYRLPSSIHIKFKRKGSFTAGIGLEEAQSHIRLSGNDAYSFHDLHADSRRRIYLRIKVCDKDFLCHRRLKYCP